MVGTPVVSLSMQTSLAEPYRIPITGNKPSFSVRLPEFHPLVGTQPIGRHHLPQCIPLHIPQDGVVLLPLFDPELDPLVGTLCPASCQSTIQWWAPFSPFPFIATPTGGHPCPLSFQRATLWWSTNSRASVFDIIGLSYVWCWFPGKS
jgi:hypothetical protein